MISRTCRMSRRAGVSTYKITALSLSALTLLFVCLRNSHNPQWRHAQTSHLTNEQLPGTLGVGGRWYIPSAWLQGVDACSRKRPLTASSSILDAAECAFELARGRQAFLNNSNIPLITHQTWRTLDSDEWSDTIRDSIEKWISTAVQDSDEYLDASLSKEHLDGPPMAWLLWNDNGIEALVSKYEPDLYAFFKLLPYAVEKADVFRIVVLKWFGGVYADVDSQPLKHPFDWVYASDLAPWTESPSKITHSLHRTSDQIQAGLSNVPPSYHNILTSTTFNRGFLSPQAVHAIFGIEADNPPASDPTYWRMGYTFPVQLTNWALAMSPHHSVAYQFLSTLRSTIFWNVNSLVSVDPLNITGPPALTAAVQAVAQREEPGLSWDALSARNGDAEGGRGKVVGDSLILPITGFNPGRGRFQNMGSQSTSHSNARLLHIAAGSWRKMDIQVEYGKLCRQLFGLCRDWSKIPVTDS